MTEYVQLKKIPWDSHARQALMPALGEDAGIIQLEVEQGVSELFYCERFGYCVTRLEQYPGLTELVLVAGSGKDLTKIVPIFEEIAALAGADRIRIHTHDAGVALLFESIGFVEYERVFIKPVKAVN